MKSEVFGLRKREFYETIILFVFVCDRLTLGEDDDESYTSKSIPVLL